MKTKRPSNDRGRARFDWLDSRHSFSFGEYYDPQHMGFGPLRVLNEDHIAAGKGFPPHPHRDMEIFSYVPAGRLAHKDSTGNASEISPGTVQLMGAGTGIVHSEFNPSAEEATHLLQVWIEPRESGLAPSYAESAYAARRPQGGGLTLLAAPDGTDGVLPIRQEARIHEGLLPAGASATLPLDDGQQGWVQLVRGVLAFEDGTVLEAGDGLALRAESAPAVTSTGEGEALFLYFQLG